MNSTREMEWHCAICPEAPYRFKMVPVSGSYSRAWDKRNGMQSCSFPVSSSFGRGAGLERA